MRTLLILIGIVLALFTGNARADGTAIVIAGNAPLHERDLFRSVMETSIRAPGRKVINVSFNTKDAAPVKACLSSSAPWTCMKGVVAPKDTDIDQIVIGSVDAAMSPAGAPAIRLSGYLVVPDLDFAIAEERNCDPCTDTLLKSLAGELARAQLRRLAVVRGRTNISLHTKPPGAIITLDGEAHGTSDAVLPTFPGSHTIQLELDGHHAETRTVKASDGETVEVNVIMRPKDDGKPGRPPPPPPPRPSRLVPILIGSAGVAAVITGGVLIAVHDPPDPDALRQPAYYYDTRTPGIITAAGGAIAIGVSIYLWRRQSDSVVTAVPFPGGAAVTWVATF